MSPDNVKLTVEFRRRNENPRQFFIHVALQSPARPEFSATLAVRTDNRTALELKKLVEAAGGSLAEYLDEKYGQKVDPSQAAHSAVIAFAQESAKLIEVGGRASEITAKLIQVRNELSRRVVLPGTAGEGEAVRLVDQQQYAIGLGYLYGAGVTPLPVEERWIESARKELGLVTLL